jgi:purine-binding chemotaxis protein CheW
MNLSQNAADSKVLTFRLAAESYGIQILKVREIIGLMEITAVPKTPSHIRGVINLRGKIVPVLDMREKFGLPAAELKRENSIITIMAESAQGAFLVGILVDSVSEVMQLDRAQIEALPALGTDLRLDFVLGLAKIQSKVIILLDIDKVILAEDLGELKKLGKELAEL